MMTHLSRILLVVFLAVAATACSEENADPADLRSELATLRSQIAEAEQAASQQKGSLLAEMAALRREVLLLSAAMLENRLIAEAGGVPAKLVAPARPPDSARAEQILRHIAATEDAIAKAREEAGERQGVAGSLSQTAVVTQELTLAQLRLAYFQSAYGIALPGQDAAAGFAADAPSPAAVDRAAPSRGGDRDSDAPSEAPRDAPGDAPGDAPRDAEDVGAVIGSVKGDAGKQQAALPPLQEVAVPQLPPVTYTRRDYSRIQLLLDEAGFDPGPIDGQWGPRTGRALAAFQRAEGLKPSGEPDAATLDALGFY